MILAGTSSTEHDEHGPYRQLYGRDRPGSRVVVKHTLRWSGTRWAKGEPHPDGTITFRWKSAIEKKIEDMHAIGMLTDAQADELMVDRVGMRFTIATVGGSP